MLIESKVRRLAFIKYLYSTAVFQSQQPDPLASASILMFHDSVELFLQLASEHLNVGKSGLGFMEYWDILNPVLPDEGLTQKESMRRLNHARVALKHHGTRPSKLDIEDLRASATSFFADNTHIVFGIDFGAVSMVDLVQCAEARESLKQATLLRQEDRIEEAQNWVAIALSQLVIHQKRRTPSVSGRSAYWFGPLLHFWGHVSDRDLRRFIDDTISSMEKIRYALEILSLGIDYRQYCRFRQLTPEAVQDANGTWRTLPWKEEGHPSLEAEDYEFCYSFVIDSALRFQEF